jgi:hypothetical protein
MTDTLVATDADAVEDGGDRAMWREREADNTSSLAQRAACVLVRIMAWVEAWYEVVEETVSATKFSVQWKPAVAVVSPWRRSLYAALKWVLNKLQVPRWHLSPLVTSQVEVPILLDDGVCPSEDSWRGRSNPTVENTTPSSIWRYTTLIAVGGCHWCCIRGMFASSSFSVMIP